MSVEIRYARRDEYGPISRFIHDHWGQNHVYVRSKPLFDWTFHRPGWWTDESDSVAVAVDGSELVGVLGGIPFRLNNKGASSGAVWIVNYVIRPDHRKGTTALKLLSQFRKHPFDATVAFGINPATSAIYQVLRGEVVSTIPRHFLVLPGCRARMEAVLQTAYPDWAYEQVRDLAAAFEVGLPRGASPSAQHTIPESWDEREWPEFAARTTGAARDSEYLRWRYLDHPCFEHRMLTVADGSHGGLLVWRLETIRRAVSNGREDLDRIGRLLEFIPASPANAEDLMTAFLHELASAGALGADFYGFHGETRAFFREFGFRETASHPAGDLLPSRFQPLDSKGGNIMSAMFLPSGFPKCAPDDDSCWYWTKSDSDQDRPN